LLDDVGIVLVAMFACGDEMNDLACFPSFHSQ
jgi:hypothetical protein